ncbi:MAG: hypothetical protein Lokiarch_43800 [Candidatus Lokiarchaeum sp. GC14_75]|nr:MAG: hypothetical protein Lokiarch_43800 [Candidatus Lokiarchaeum sp. GC14_75]
MKEKAFSIFYFSGLIITTIIMLLQLFRIISFDIIFLFFFWAINFLSGFGIILSLANLYLLFLDKLRNKLDKKAVKIFLFIEILIPVFLAIYAIFKIFRKRPTTPTGFWFWVDNILYIYGIISLLLNLYIIPIIRDEIQKAMELGKYKWWRKKATKVSRNIKKRYFLLKKEFARAQIQDQMTAKEILNLWHRKFAIGFLLIIALGALIFTPIAFICAAYWLKLYIFYKIRINRHEKYLILLSMILIGFFACIAPFLNLNAYIAIIKYFWTTQLFYLLGIIFASFVFITKILNLQGISATSIKLRRRKQKIKKLEKEKEDLQKLLQEIEDN